MPISQIVTNSIANGAVIGADIADGTIGLGKLSATGTANATTFLRGDNSWQTVTQKITAVSFYENSTRQVTSTTANYEIYSWSWTKNSGSTDWLIQGLVPFQGHTNDGSNMYISINGTPYYTGSGESQGGVTGLTQGLVMVQLRISGIGAGSRTVAFGWSVADGSSNRNFNVVNQNSSDDSRNRQTGSVFTCWEIA
jgi:hypothetical protein